MPIAQPIAQISFTVADIKASFINVEDADTIAGLTDEEIDRIGWDALAHFEDTGALWQLYREHVEQSAQAHRMR